MIRKVNVVKAAVLEVLTRLYGEEVWLAEEVRYERRFMRSLDQR